MQLLKTVRDQPPKKPPLFHFLSISPITLLNSERNLAATLYQDQDRIKIQLCNPNPNYPNHAIFFSETSMLYYIILDFPTGQITDNQPSIKSILYSQRESKRQTIAESYKDFIVRYNCDSIFAKQIDQQGKSLQNISCNINNQITVNISIENNYAKELIPILRLSFYSIKPITVQEIQNIVARANIILTFLSQSMVYPFDIVMSRPQNIHLLSPDMLARPSKITYNPKTPNINFSTIFRNFLQKDLEPLIKWLNIINKHNSDTPFEEYVSALCVSLETLCDKVLPNQTNNQKTNEYKQQFDALLQLCEKNDKVISKNTIHWLKNSEHFFLNRTRFEQKIKQLFSIIPIQPCDDCCFAGDSDTVQHYAALLAKLRNRLSHYSTLSANLLQQVKTNEFFLKEIFPDTLHQATIYYLEELHTNKSQGDDIIHEKN